MHAPIRALIAFRPKASVGLIGGAAAVSSMFAATPFLVPAIADRHGVPLGTAGLISVAQVAGFTIANLVAGRIVRPRVALLIPTAAALASVNAASAWAGSFGLLLALRGVAGVAAGLITWLAWIDAMSEPGIMRDVAGAGPLMALVTAPLFGWLAFAGRDPVIFLFLTVLAALPILLPARLASQTVPGRRRVSPSRSNLVLLGALGIATLAGSSLFVFSAAMARTRIGMGSLAIALGFSLNSAGGLVATRFRATRAWPWVGAIALSIAAMAGLPHPAMFLAAMTLWGFAFWMAIPEVLRQVAAWSLAPAERVGDAQALLALGRVAGPGIGGVLVGSGSFGWLGVEATGGTLLAAALVGGVERYRRHRTGPRPAA